MTRKWAHVCYSLGFALSAGPVLGALVALALGQDARWRGWFGLIAFFLMVLHGIGMANTRPKEKP